MKHKWITQHSHMLAHGHICTHTQKHTLTPALVHKCSHPHMSTQELHMHRSSTSTQTLVYMHLKHTYRPLRDIHLQPRSSSSMQTVTHTHGGSHSHTVMPSYIQRHSHAHEDNHKLRMSLHLTHTQRCPHTHRHTRLLHAAAHPGQECALTHSQTPGHTCGHCACAHA